MIQLRASMGSDATVHGGAEALRAKLAFVEEKVYAGTEGLVTDSVLTKWLKEFDTNKTKAVMNTVFLVPKSGTNKWRLVMNFRWLNAHCIKSKVQNETLKKLRRPAKPDDWCFSFDLQDGYHAVSIDPEL
eukprot:gene20068-biopygen20693